MVTFLGVLSNYCDYVVSGYTRVRVDMQADLWTVESGKQRSDVE